MSTLFNRAWLLTAGPAGAPGFSWGTEIPGADPNNAPKMSFQVKRTSRRGSNKATIKLWNLNPISIGVLETAGTVITLSVGYKGAGAAFGNLGNIFIGDVARKGVVTVKEGKDKVTTIEAGDAELSLQQTRSDISLAPGATTAEALNLLILKMLIGPGNIATLPPIPFTTGWSHFGLAREALTEIADMYGATWSIQDRLLNILRSGEALPGEAVLLSSATGMVGDPRRTKDGIEVRSLMQPVIVPGKVISVVSTSALGGFYKAKEVMYSGDSRQLDWYTDVKARTLEVAI